MSHVLEKNLDHYREMKVVRDKLDYIENSFYMRRTNPPLELRKIAVAVEDYMMGLRA